MRRIVAPKTLDEICNEWDCLCNKRHELIEAGRDISLSAVTAPCILDAISMESPSNVLDVGCGTGYVTNLIAERVCPCVGIDASSKSIEVAKESYSSSKLWFYNSTIASFNSDTMFDMCISNMALSSDPCWVDSLENVFRLLEDRGLFLIMLPHPCFWARHWGIQEEPWFDYNEELYIEHDFSITLAKSLGKTTYIHRPLHHYINNLVNVGFEILGITEPYPYKKTPLNYSYDFPRFLLIKCRKKK